MLKQELPLIFSQSSVVLEMEVDLFYLFYSEFTWTSKLASTPLTTLTWLRKESFLNFNFEFVNF